MKINCKLCNREFEVTEEQAEPFMVFHTIVEHPMDFLGQPKVQQFIATGFEKLGGLLADKMRGKNG